MTGAEQVSALADLAERAVARELESEPTWNAAAPQHEIDAAIASVTRFDRSARRARPFAHGSPVGRRVFAFPPLIGYGALFRLLSELVPEQLILGFNYLESEQRIALYVAELEALEFGRDDVLLGYCGGGTLAFHVAQQLEQRGHAVSSLVCLDTPETWHEGNLPEDPYSRQTKVVDRFLAYMGATDPAVCAVLRRRVVARAGHYLSALRVDNCEGSIGADIHLIHSAQYVPGDGEWLARTTGRVRRYASGAGHNSFLGGEHGHETAQILRSIEAG